MKTLRMLSTWLMVLVCLSLTTTACSDDDDDEPGATSDLVGTWEGVSSEGWEIYDGEKEEWNETNNSTRIVFNKDNTCVGYYKSGNTWKKEYIGTWEYKNGKIYSTTWDPEYPEDDDSDVDVATVLELTSSKLVVESSEEDYYEKSTWRKVND
jgi:hypothetical protein